MAFLAVNLEGRAFSLTLLAGSAPVPEWQAARASLLSKRFPA